LLLLSLPLPFFSSRCRSCFCIFERTLCAAAVGLWFGIQVENSSRKSLNIFRSSHPLPPTLCVWCLRWLCCAQLSDPRE
jgi:hypothetical protein